MDYPPEITSYSVLNRTNFYRHTSKEWKKRNYISLETQKVTANGFSDWNTPWDFVNNDKKRGMWCRRAQELAEMYNMIPPFCINCWKIVVKPRKHSELILLRNIQREMAENDPDCWCKCGIELRNYVPGLYGGYFYTDSKEMGINRYKQVRENVPEHIPVILKRYCTEFEMRCGDSIDTEKRQPEDVEELQKFYFAHIDEPLIMQAQPKLIKLEVYQGWIDWGWKFGSEEDRSEIERTYNDGKPLYPQPRKYEE